MKKLISIMLVTALLCSLLTLTAAEETDTSESLSQIQPLPVISQYYNFLYSKTEEKGVFYVDLPDHIEDFFKMPTYAWYINGEEADVIDSVIIEFDILGSVEPLDSVYYGCDTAFYITLHNFEPISFVPVWPAPEFEKRQGDLDVRSMLQIPDIGIDLRDYAVQDGEHVTITIPYAQFQNLPKDLALQFTPGTTYGNIHAYLYGDNGLDESILDTIAQKTEIPQRDLLHKVIMPTLQVTDDYFVIPLSDADSPEGLGGIISVDDVIDPALVLNDDGSVNMAAALFDLGDYADEVQGKYAVIPEGLVPTLMMAALQPVFSDDERRQLVDFILSTMMDENHQFYGIFDIEQGKMIAADRKAATLPILSALLLCGGAMKKREADLIVDSIIENEIIRIGDTLYYAPNGISPDGEMTLNLSDFAITTCFFWLMSEYSYDRDRLEEPYGGAILLEGLANSFRLILEGQEQNETRLPSTSLLVTFADDGKSYVLQPSDTFDINNSYFAVGLMEYESYRTAKDQFWFDELNMEKFDATINNLGGIKAGAVTGNQARIIRDCEAVAAEQFNFNTIANTLFQSYLQVYYFLKGMPETMIYAPAYNVHTGEKIWRWGTTTEEKLRPAAGLIRRFGSPATSMNYFMLAGMFNDEVMVKETAHLAIVNLEFYVSRLFRERRPDITDPDLYTNNGFNLWGYDSLKYAMRGFTAQVETRYHYDTSGTTIIRETWLEFMMRRVNDKIGDEQNRFKIGDEFPLFYDDFPEFVISD